MSDCLGKQCAVNAIVVAFYTKTADKSNEREPKQSAKRVYNAPLN